MSTMLPLFWISDAPGMFVYPFARPTANQHNRAPIRARDRCPACLDFTRDGPPGGCPAAAP